TEQASEAHSFRWSSAGSSWVQQAKISLVLAVSSNKQCAEAGSHKSANSRASMVRNDCIRAYGCLIGGACSIYYFPGFPRFLAGKWWRARNIAAGTAFGGNNFLYGN